MCEKAEEIQQNPEVVELKTMTAIHQSSVVNGVCIVLAYYFYLPSIYTQWFNKDAVWLPRQDQLQEMIDWGKGRHPQDWFRYFYEWIKQHDQKWVHFYSTAEQLWLAFVMQEKYGKVWDSVKKDWVKGGVRP